jgi:hypothetical protein
MKTREQLWKILHSKLEDIGDLYSSRQAISQYDLDDIIDEILELLQPTTEGSKEVDKKHMPLKEYCQYLEDVSSAGDSINGNALQEYIEQFAQQNNPPKKEKQ